MQDTDIQFLLNQLSSTTSQAVNTDLRSVVQGEAEESNSTKGVAVADAPDASASGISPAESSATGREAESKKSDDGTRQIFALLKGLQPVHQRPLAHGTSIPRYLKRKSPPPSLHEEYVPKQPRLSNSTSTLTKLDDTPTFDEESSTVNNHQDLSFSDATPPRDPLDDGDESLMNIDLTEWSDATDFHNVTPPGPLPLAFKIEHKERDIRYLTFAQSLPIISQLTADESFMERISNMKSQQDELELHMIDERNRLRNAIVTNGINVEKELRQSDERFLSRWNDLRSSQQAEMETLGVPTFFVTQELSMIEKQSKVLNAILAILDES